jgi:adenosylcobyric acid synthase
VVVAYPYTAIADDLCPLEGDSRIRVESCRRRIPKPYPHMSTVILHGYRLTKLDLKWMKDSGWASFIRKHVLGICGGYQMLAIIVDDPNGCQRIIRLVTNSFYYSAQ